MTSISHAALLELHLSASELQILRSPRLGYCVGAPVTCTAALKNDLFQKGLVSFALCATGGLTEKGLAVSCFLRS